MTHLTDTEKQQIISLFHAGVSHRGIARQMQRNPSTISRFLRTQKDLSQSDDEDIITNTIQIRIQQYTNIFNLLLKKDIGMSHINNYTALFSSYLQTDIKPDKQYSMLYTMLHYLNPQTEDIIADIGC